MTSTDPHLFDPTPYDKPLTDYNFADWTANAHVYHGSAYNPQFSSAERKPGRAFLGNGKQYWNVISHAGTQDAAIDRVRGVRYESDRANTRIDERLSVQHPFHTADVSAHAGYLHPLQFRDPAQALEDTRSVGRDEGEWTRSTVQAIHDSGRYHFYRNEHEGEGSVSVAAHPQHFQSYNDMLEGKLDRGESLTEAQSLDMEHDNMRLHLATDSPKRVRPRQGRLGLDTGTLSRSESMRAHAKTQHNHWAGIEDTKRRRQGEFEQLKQRLQ